MTTKSRLSPMAVAVLVGVWSLLVAPLCRAGMVGVELDPLGPTVQALSGSGAMTYTLGTGEVQATLIGDVFAYDPLPLTFALLDASTISINLFVNSSGGFVANGTGFQLTGDMDADFDGFADVSGDLLHGQILAFGARGAGPPTVAFDFLFKIEGGALTSDIPLSGGGSVARPYTAGNLGGGILFAESVTTGTLGDFSASFSSDSTKGVFGNAIPLPGAAAMGAVILAALVLRRAYKHIGAGR